VHLQLNWKDEGDETDGGESNEKAANVVTKRTKKKDAGKEAGYSRKEIPLEWELPSYKFFIRRWEALQLSRERGSSVA